jgi:hypothetical protein
MEEATAKDGDGISRFEPHGADASALESASFVVVASLDASLADPLVSTGTSLDASLADPLVSTGTSLDASLTASLSGSVPLDASLGVPLELTAPLVALPAVAASLGLVASVVSPVGEAGLPLSPGLPVVCPPLEVGLPAALPLLGPAAPEVDAPLEDVASALAPRPDGAEFEGSSVASPVAQLIPAAQASETMDRLLQNCVVASRRMKSSRYGKGAGMTRAIVASLCYEPSPPAKRRNEPSSGRRILT